MHNKIHEKHVRTKKMCVCDNVAQRSFIAVSVPIRRKVVLISETYCMHCKSLSKCGGQF